MTGGSGKTFVGFGFGPIQSGLFLYEAYASGRFSRFVVSEIDADLVQAVRSNGGRYTINIARKDRIDQAHVDRVHMHNPRDDADREAIVDAIRLSDELATALPSVTIYEVGGPASVVSLINEGHRRRREPVATVVYAAENNNHAAEILAAHLAADAAHVQTLNTVIGKMSGMITDDEEIRRLDLATITPDIPRAILVEEFNRILISRIALPGYRRGIDVFVEKDDLLPFEEAKLYGHNAIHALIAYLSDLKGLDTIAQAADHADIMASARQAFLAESGAALIKKHGGLGDPLFTADGYRAYADDLLKRMVCPNLNDLVDRVGRDHVRKLGYDDRLYGTMRMALEHNIEPIHLARGAAAGVLSMIKRRGELVDAPSALPESADTLTRSGLNDLLREIWGGRSDKHTSALIDLTFSALAELRT